MERVLTQEERIRRAEEIYLRRRNTRPQYRNTRENINIRQELPKGKSITLFKKMALQIVICLLLYCIFYLIYDTNYSFSDTTISKTQEILNYDINFDEIYKYVSGNIKEFINEKLSLTKENTGTDNVEGNANNEETQNNEEINGNEGQADEKSISNETTPEDQSNNEEIPVQVQQTSASEPDLKQQYSLINPVKRWTYIIRIWRKRSNLQNCIN